MHPVAAMGIATICFSFFPILNALGIMHTTPILMSGLNHVFTIIMAFILVMVLSGKPRLMLKAIISFKDLPKRVITTAFLSGMSIYLGIVFFLFSMNLMSKAGATAIAEMWPALAVFIAPFVIRKKWQPIRSADIWVLISCIVGVVLITASEKGQGLNDFIYNPFFMKGDAGFSEYIGIFLALLSAYCFAFSGVARAHFANSLPQEFRDKYFKGGVTTTEAMYSYMLTYIASLPLVIIVIILLESQYHVGTGALLPAITNGLLLTIMSSMYSYALLKSDSSNVVAIWYIGPALAAIWLVIFGFSEATDLLILGAIFIFFPNAALVFLPNKSKTVTMHEDFETVESVDHDTPAYRAQNAADKTKKAAEECELKQGEKITIKRNIE